MGRRSAKTLDTFPPLLLALVMASVLGASLTTVVLALAIVTIPLYARLTRAQMLGVKQTEYVLAARSIGASPPRIAISHVLLNSLTPIIAAATLGMSYAILGEAGLSFLGLGVQPPSPTWGAMLTEASRYIYVSWYMVLFPGCALFLLVLALNLLGDAVQEWLKPRP